MDSLSTASVELLPDKEGSSIISDSGQQLFCYSLIKNVSDINPQRIDSEWETFVKSLARPVIRGDMPLDTYRQLLQDAEANALRKVHLKTDALSRKAAIRAAQQPIKHAWQSQKDGPAWIPAVFGQQLNARGHQRYAGNVIALYAAVLDIDKNITRTRIETTLHGLCYAAHTSYTHHPAAEKWRVIIPLKKPLPPSFADAICDYFSALFGDGLDTHCRNPDHLYFRPACPPDATVHYQHFSRIGGWFDGAALRDTVARQRVSNKRRVVGEELQQQIPASLVEDLLIGPRFKQLILTGEGPYPSRSEAVFAVVQELLRAGLADGQIADILLNPAYPISAKPREKGLLWIQSEITRAYAKARYKPKSVHKIARPSTEQAAPNEKSKQVDSTSPARKSQATVLVEQIADIVLFHDAEGITYTTLDVCGHQEHWPIRSKAFRDWLSHQFWQVQRKAPSSQALTDALGVIDGLARYESPEHPVFLRVASKSGRLYLDLSDQDWRCIEITEDGWRIISRPPVRFIRRPGMLPLPPPTAGGNLHMLWDFLNVSAEERVLVFAWLVQALRDRGPYPVLIVQGEQGTAKTWLCRLLRALTDPSVATVRTLPRDERDLLIAARNGHVIALDNLSGLQPWLSDALCRLATGGGFSTRQLYTDAEEVMIQVQRPILLNGIDDIATRQDLIDRAIIINLEPIATSARRPESELWSTFKQGQPYILGALLNAMVTGLRQLPRTHLSALPRLADFALWASAAETAWGAEAGEFMRMYRRNRTDAVEAGLEGAPVAKTLRAWCSQQGSQGSWTGTSPQLLAALNQTVKSEPGVRTWPKSAKALSGQLKRLATGLRSTGIHVSHCKSADGNQG